MTDSTKEFFNGLLMLFGCVGIFILIYCFMAFAAYFVEELTPTQAKNAGFDEQGNPPEKLKCYRHYKKRKDIGAPLFKELDK